MQQKQTFSPDPQQAKFVSSSSTQRQSFLCFKRQWVYYLQMVHTNNGKELLRQLRKAIKAKTSRKTEDVLFHQSSAPLHVLAFNGSCARLQNWLITLTVLLICPTTYKNISLRTNIVVYVFFTKRVTSLLWWVRCQFNQKVTRQLLLRRVEIKASKISSFLHSQHLKCSSYSRMGVN